MSKLIKFYRWINPLKAKLNIEDEDGELSEGKDDEDKESMSTTKVVSTPFGMIPVDNNWLIDKHIDFWMMETNFNIGTEIVDFMKSVEGIEIFHVFTRYKARVGIPKSGFFESKVVLSQIREGISNLFRSQHLQQIIELPQDIVSIAMNTRDQLHANTAYWGILILPNGNIEVVKSIKNDKEYREKLQLLKTTCATVGGKVLTSE
jgi:hypothetical protein